MFPTVGLSATADKSRRRRLTAQHFLTAHTHLKQQGTFFQGHADMRVFIQSIMIFFGTLMAAGLVALGEPAGAELDIVGAVTSAAR
jgi:hypothetical protein